MNRRTILAALGETAFCLFVGMIGALIVVIVFAGVFA